MEKLDEIQGNFAEFKSREKLPVLKTNFGTLSKKTKYYQFWNVVKKDKLLSKSAAVMDLRSRK